MEEDSDYPKPHLKWGFILYTEKVSFYQKYRPKKIGELNLQSVRDLLLSTMESGNVSHAYLFVGPRGSGKTSAARILAKLVNCEKNKDKKKLSEPCGECEACMLIENGSGVDIVEIDAASNGLVEDIRDLREKVRLSPLQLKKKVYIIDEVHMVSSAGFNALLKTLEEPPKHVMFVLCTTEAHKVPETIVSRCARVSFPKAGIEEMAEALQRAIEGENLQVSPEALAMIADAADGSFREGHKLLEQLANFGVEISEELAKKSLGMVGRSYVKKLIEAVEEKDANAVVEFFVEMEKAGVKPGSLLSSLLNVLKVLMEEGVKDEGEISVYMKMASNLIRAADEVRVSPDPLLPIEIALLSMCQNRGDTVTPLHRDTPEKDERVDVQIKTMIPKEFGLVDIEKIKNEWGNFLNDFAGVNVSLAGLLRQSEPTEIQGKAITLSVRNKFQQDMLERDVKKKVIEEAMERVWGPVTFKTVLGEITDQRINRLTDEDSGGETMMKVEEIFG